MSVLWHLFNRTFQSSLKVLGSAAVIWGKAWAISSLILSVTFLTRDADSTQIQAIALIAHVRLEGSLFPVY